MTETILINQKAWSSTLVTASEDPNEVCGIMIGNENHVKEIVMVPSEKPSPVRFEFDAWKAGEVHLYARAKGLKVIGIFHSHPGNHPQPSSTDHEWMEENPYVWTIYSPLYRTWQSWRRIGDVIVNVITEIVK